MITVENIIKATFADYYEIKNQASVIYGDGNIQKQHFHIVGVNESTFLGCEQAMVMAEKLLHILKNGSKDPILLFVDVAGQALSMHDEWLGMEQYFAHLLSVLAALRRNGNKIIALICNEAIGGAFIAYGLMADKIFALPDAKVAVMWLEGVAKITKVPYDTLVRLSETYPVFAPGVDNFYQLGGIHEVIRMENIVNEILAAVNTNIVDERAKLGAERGGRKLAYSVINTILQECN